MIEASEVRSARWRLALACVLLTGIWLAMLVGGRGQLDRAIYTAFYAGGRPSLILIARILTALGEPTVLIAVSAMLGLWLWRAGRGRAGAAVLLVTLTGRGFTEMQKYWVARARPDLEPHLVIVKTSSFPSGHAASSMIFYVTVAIALGLGTRWHRRATAGAILLSLLIGASRVMLGVHWPSDVIGGWSFGLLWVLLTLKPAERLLRTDTQ